MDDWSDDDDDDEGGDDIAEADLGSDEIETELRAFFGANAAKVKTVLQLWNAYADVYNACCDEWTQDTNAYREERAFKLLKAGLELHELLNNVSNRRHKSTYFHAMWAVASRQMKEWGDLWRFSTRAVEGRGGRLKRIGRRMICWRRRSTGKYRRIVRDKVIEQTYSSAPERQLMRAACAREDRAHTQQRSRVATTGRNTLVRTGLKADPAAKVALGGNLSLDFVRKMGTAARTDDRLSEAWRL